MIIFLSYTRLKDSSGVVTKFRKHVEDELNGVSPGSNVLQDKWFIETGDKFPKKIAEALHEADALMVLVSPAWLASEWCRREFEIFSSRTDTPEIRSHILPVLWVDTPAIQKNSNDPIARALADIDYTDWRKLRFQTWGNPTLRSQAAKLAEVAARSAAKIPSSDRTVADEKDVAQIAGGARP